ncbi:MAG TPA: aminomethyltransferase beta-barrel domain-containing protein, partial [Candidatus Acidoferrum sp.]|nr:aminomethyltransferase beta-barrel domain-containing protein [Candidatus Acidoferrum sp.]
LRRALTPLGKMTKPQIREIAHSLGLKVADKIDSQEICFVPGNDYKAFLRSHLGENEFHRGEIFDVAGNFLGEHGGIELFTIGQRKGLPGGSPQPRYVVDLDPATNRVIVGDADDLVTDEFEIDGANWQPEAGVVDPGPRSATAATTDSSHSEEIEVTVKIRYSHPGARATLTRFEDGHAHVRLHDPQRAVTPGQAAVFYDDDIVLGGGWICRSVRPERSEAESKDAVLLP